MQRYDYGQWFGVALVVVGVAAFVFSYPPTLVLGVQMATLAAAGVLFVLAGVRNPLRDRVGPHRLTGVGDVLLGASIAVSALGTTTGGGSTVYNAAAVLGGGALVFIGLLYVFRPRYFGLGPDGYPVRRK